MRKIVLESKYVQPLDDYYRNRLNQNSYEHMMMTMTPFEINVADECPVCHYEMDMSSPHYRNWHNINDDSKIFDIISVHHCLHCHNGFIVIHHMVKNENGFIEKSQSVYPTTLTDLQIEEDIRSISPEFYEIYKQCIIAKNNGLNQLYGMGFRKALEMLVTDFAISQNPDDKNEILEASLNKRIEIYFKNSDAKTALMACKWLGNNETHYSNYNTNEDLLLLEKLINDVLYYICREIRNKKAEDINAMKGRR